MNVPFLKEVLDQYRREVENRDRDAAMRRNVRIEKRQQQLEAELLANSVASHILSAANMVFVYSDDYADVIAQGMAFGETFYLVMQEWNVEFCEWLVVCEAVNWNIPMIDTRDLDSELVRVLDALDRRLANA